MRAEQSKKFQFYGFLRDYHELKERHSPKFSLIDPRPITAILDGQQRLTSLNIGLCGSHAVKKPYRRRDDPSAYPLRELHLDLRYEPSDDDDIQYRFDFLTPEQARVSSDEHTWYPVPEVLDLGEGPAIFKYIQDQGLESHPRAYFALDALHRAVHRDSVISYYEEKEQDLNRVLDIFVRVNSGGTVLSKSDLLLSIATADWTRRDARDAVNGLVDDLNTTHQGFNFSKDLVLKSGLVMTDIKDVGFKVANFTRENMDRLDESWDGVDDALRRSVKLLAGFGFSERTLSANSALIPVADYLHHRGHGDAYLRSVLHQDDRKALRSWLIRSLTKRGVWGSGLDTLLVRIRAVMRQTSGGFPAKELEAEMSRLGKSLRFAREDLADLVATEYKHKRVFPLLTLLYPWVDVRNDFHVDHIFPRALFRRDRLLEAGVAESEIPEFEAKCNLLPNLQLLEGSVNSAKSDVSPMEWARTQHPDGTQRDAYLAGHDLLGLPDDIRDFPDFFALRERRLEARLSELLEIT